MRQTTCINCGELFDYKPRKLYCDPCRVETNKQRALRKHHATYTPVSTSTCRQCGAEFAYIPNKLYCSSPCKVSAKRAQSLRDYNKNKPESVKRIIKVQPVRKPKRIDRDAEQRRINAEIDARFNAPCEYRHLTPKHPDFMQIANIYIQREMAA